MWQVSRRAVNAESVCQLIEDAVVDNQGQGFDHEAHESTFGSESQFAKNKERHQQLFKQDKLVLENQQ